MQEDNVELRGAIERLHKSRAYYLESIAVVEKFRNKTVWRGKVHVFQLINHPHADKCYAWYSDNHDTGKRRYYAVLHIPPIDSPEKAVRASIVFDHKKENQ